jgi:RHS repeat-associated protein
LLGQYNPSNSPYNEVIYLDGTPVGAASTGGTTETRDTALRVFAGHEGEPRRVTDNHMNAAWTWDSDPFANGTANIQPGTLGAFPDDMRMPGQLWFAENGNNFNMSRIYVPVRGRYLQSDKIGLNGGINTYAYVGNNSANLVDPSGTDANGVFGSYAGQYYDDYQLQRNFYRAFDAKNLPNTTQSSALEHSIESGSENIGTATDLMDAAGLSSKTASTIGAVAGCFTTSAKLQEFRNSPNFDTGGALLNSYAMTAIPELSVAETLWSILKSPLPKGSDLSKQYAEPVPPATYPIWWFGPRPLGQRSPQ